jgi:hypothetical protein
MGPMVVPGAKEPTMTAIVQTEKSNVRELSLEEMEQVSGGETLNEFIQGTIILIKCVLATGGLHIATTLN